MSRCAVFCVFFAHQCANPNRFLDREGCDLLARLSEGEDAAQAREQHLDRALARRLPQLDESDPADSQRDPAT